MTLVQDIVEIWRRCRPAASTDAIHERAGRHLIAQLACTGRHTITNLMCMGNRVRQDWAADYRMYSQDRLDTRKVFDGIRRELLVDLPAADPLVVAMDDSLIRRTGAKVHGVGYRRDPLSPPFHTNLVRGQRILQLSVVRPLPGDDWRCVPIVFEHTPTPLKPKRDADPAIQATYREARRQSTMGLCGQRELTRLRDGLDADGAADRPLISVVDGRFTVGTLLLDLPERTTIIGRLRKDAKLHYLPTSQPATGRRRIYGDLAPTPEALRTDPTIPYREIELPVRGETHRFRVKSLPAVRWRPAGERDLKLLVISPIPYRNRPGGHTLYRQPTYLISTDPTLSDDDIVRHYLTRWDIEVNFRDEKTLLGVGQAQVATPASNRHVPSLAVAAYGMLQLVAARHHVDLPLLSRPKWQSSQPRRPTTPQLLQLLRHELFGESLQRQRFSGFTSSSGADQTLEKLLPIPYASLIRPIQ